MFSVVGRPLVGLTVSGGVRKAAGAMADALAKIPDVEIDPEGTFKYILVRVKVKDGDVHKDIVRGTKSAEYHNHIFEKVNPAMEALGMECKCLGGGKIEHNSQDKKLRVFGESTVLSVGQLDLLKLLETSRLSAEWLHQLRRLQSCNKSSCPPDSTCFYPDLDS